MVQFFWSFAVFCTACCAALTLQRVLHMFQQAGYQHPSYRQWLRKNRKEPRAAKRWMPVLILCAGIYFGKWWLLLVGAALFVLLCRPAKAKKPLVYTPRVIRLAVTAALFFILYILFCYYAYYWCVVMAYATGSLALVILGTLAPLTCPAVLILLQYRLVLLYDWINRPLEKAINNRYLREARDILRGMPGLTVIGITGSYGKTSVKHDLFKLLSGRYEVYMTPGNYNTTLGVVRAIREGLRPTHQIFLCEMGARHLGDIREICDLVHPKIGILTSVGPQHLETFGSQENVLRGKLELAQAVEDGGTLFINRDSPLLAAHEFDQKLITYGSNNCDYTISNQKIDEDGASFIISAPDGTQQAFRTRLLGGANVQNLCGAVALAHTLGVPLPELAAAAQALDPVPHRLELRRGEGLSIIDDAYNSNPEGAKIALDTLAMGTGTKICITPGLVELGEQELAYNRDLGAYAAGRCDWLLTVGKQARTEAIRQGAAESGLRRDRILSCDTVQEAVLKAHSLPGEHKLALLLNDLTDNY